MFAGAVDNGEFHIALERSSIYWLPVHNEFIRARKMTARETARLEKGKSRAVLLVPRISVAVTLPLGLHL